MKHFLNFFLLIIAFLSVNDSASILAVEANPDSRLLSGRAHYLASNGSFKDFEDFLKKHPSIVDSIDDVGDHLALSAAINRSSDNFELVIQLRPELKNRRNRWHRSPIHYAIMFGSIEVLRFLLDREPIDLNKQDPLLQDSLGSGSPLRIAVRNLQFEVVKFLVERGAKVRTSQDRRPELAIKHFIESQYPLNPTRKLMAEEIHNFIGGFPYPPHDNPDQRAIFTRRFVEEVQRNGFSQDAKELITIGGASLTDIVEMKFENGYYTVRANALGLLTYYAKPEEFKEALKLIEFAHEDLDVAIRALHFFARITRHQNEDMIQNYITLRKLGACGPGQGVDYLDFQDGRRSFEKHEIESK
jgi:hypothetical protein